MDKVFVEQLKLQGKHGIHAHERASEQEFLIDIEVEFDTRVAAKSDDIADTVDYRKFCEIARDAVEGNSFYLIEKLGDTIALKILEDTRIARVDVVIRKPAALESGVAGVKIIRTQE